jgi:hypothetical protein
VTSATPTSIFDGLALVDGTGKTILATTVLSLLAGICAHVFIRAGYAALEADLRGSDASNRPFRYHVLERIVREAEQAAGRTREVNTQAIIEDAFQAELRPLLLAERFVRAATGLVIILGLLGTFYGLTMSIGRLVNLVSADPGAAADVTHAVTGGLTQALTGMAVAFSNSLVGISSAVVLTVVGVLSNVTERRNALMVQLETYLERRLPAPAPAPSTSVGDAAAFHESVARLEGTVARFDAALQRLSADTKDLREIQLVVALKSGGKG